MTPFRPHLGRRLCHDDVVGPRADEEQAQAVAVAALRASGAAFAYLHGSRAAGRATRRSDVDVAAWWPTDPPVASDIGLPAGYDLMVLNAAPLELRGRVAAAGRLLFEDDAAARVRWEATTRKIWFDERPRFERSHREFLAVITGA